MAISLNGALDKLTRNGSYITPTASFTFMGWAKQGATTPGGGAFRLYYEYGDPAAGIDPYIYVGSSANDVNFVCEIYDGSSYFDTANYMPVTGTYFHWAVRYDGDTTVDFIIDGSIFDSLTVNVAGIVFSTEDEQIGGGGWEDFISAGIGVYSRALTLHEILIQSRYPRPRYYDAIGSFTPLCPWDGATTLFDFTVNGHDWTLTGAKTPQISPTIPVSLPFDTQFEDDFDGWTNLSWSISSTHLVSDFTKPTQGCAYRNVYTSACHSSFIELYLVSPPDVPVEPTVSAPALPNISVLFTGAAFSTAGVVPDGTTSIDATLAPGVFLINLSIPQSTVGSSRGPSAFLIVQTGGTLALALATSGGGYTNFFSSPNAFPIDGLTRGVQVSLAFSSLDAVVFSVLVDNAVAITGSFGSLDHTTVEGASGSFGVGMVQFENSRDVITTGFFTAFDRVRVVTDPSIISWSGCSTATTLVAAATFCALPERTVPVPTTTTYPTVRERVFALPFETNLMLFLSRIEFLIQAGQGLSAGQGSNPTVAVFFSKDGGKTYGNGYTVFPGQIGEYDKRAYLNRIGRARNWVCKIRVSDPVFWAFLDCYADLEEGTS